MFKQFLKVFNLTESEENRVNVDLKILGAEVLVKQLVDMGCQMILYGREENRKRWPKEEEKYKKLIKKVISKASAKLSAGRT